MCHASVRSVTPSGRARRRYGRTSQPITRVILPSKDSKKSRFWKVLRTRSGFSRDVEARRSFGDDYLNRGPSFPPPPIRFTPISGGAGELTNVGQSQDYLLGLCYNLSRIVGWSFVESRTDSVLDS